MALRGTKDDALIISVIADTTGLTDLEVIVTKPDGTDEATNVSLTEVGSKKIYKGTYTPTAVGVYYLEIESPTETGLDGKRKSLHVLEFDESDIDTKLDSMDTKLDTLSTDVAGVKTAVDSQADDHQIGFLD
ncbi:hypothetical protein GR7B_00190 [Vibrio phage vB_VcorM_GR7B]|nr:hypothetical protein GR7B_00190 [Vibrio phage vB_VcorM_GR7B]